MAGKLKFKTCFTMHVQCTYPYPIFSRVFGIFVETFTLGEKNEKSALYLRVNVFSMRGLSGETIFMSPTGDGTAILLGHPSHVKV